MSLRHRRVFIVRGAQHHRPPPSSNLYLTPGEAVLDVKGHGEYSAALHLRVEGAAPVAPEGVDRLSGVTNILRGTDPARWQRQVPTYAKVIYLYPKIRPGVDWVFYGAGNHLEYDLVVPTAIVWATYLGGSVNASAPGATVTPKDRGLGVAADAVGNVYVTGGTKSEDFTAIAPSCTPWQCASTSISFDGRCTSSSDCGVSRSRHGRGSMRCDSTTRACSPTGICSRAPTADCRGRMTGDCHVRSCESGRVRLPPATHQIRTPGLTGGRWRSGTGPGRDG